MEPAGLGVGIAGLAGLLSSCLDVLERVQTYRSFASDSALLNTQFEAGKQRYKQWGNNVGDGLLSADDDMRLVVDEIQNQINKILDANSASETKKAKGRLVHKFGLGTSTQASTHEGGTESRRRRLAWALGEKEDRKDQVSDLADLVQQLHNLVPPGQSEGKPSKPDGTLTEEQVLLGEVHLALVNIRNALVEAQANMRREMHTWILGNNLPNERFEDSCHRRLSGTCEWVLSLPAFTRWSAPPGQLDCESSSGTHELLWIHGPPGFGKTLLCSRIVEYLSATVNTPVAYFFFSSDHGSRDDPHVVMRFWVSQLALHSEVSTLIHQKWISGHEKVASRTTIIELLHEALRATPGCYLVVDGLDECTAQSNSNSSVTRFLEDVRRAATPTTRVLVVSRDESEIRQALRAPGQVPFSEYRITPEDVRSDTNIFSRAIVDRKLPNKDEKVKTTLSRTMTNRCEGQFMWLQMQEQCLEADMNARHLQRVLESTPTELGYVYKRTWERILRNPRSQRALALLRWAAFALRPLNVMEITEAVLIIEDDSDVLADELPDAIDEDYVENGILKLCAPLLEVSSTELEPKDRTVRLAHFTIREFLIGRLPTQYLSQNEALRVSDEQIQNTMLARLCLWYIQSRQVWSDGADIHGLPFEAALRDYAASSWPSHVMSGVPLDQDSGLLERILGFMSVDHPCFDTWRQWADAHDDEFERQQAEDEEMPPEPAYYALKLGLMAVAARLIRGSNQATTRPGRSVLNLCCIEGHAALARIALDAGANIETRTGRGRTPLYSASVEGHLDIVQLLLDRGAHLDVTTNSGWTPLNTAADEGYTEIVKLLVDKGADTKMASNNGWVSVNSAADSGHLDVVRFLVDNGADITIANNNGATPLYCAATEGHLEIVKFLVNRGADISVTNRYGWTVVNTAASDGHLDVVKFLVGRGADILTADIDGWTPIYNAADSGHLDVVKFLVEKGADITEAVGDSGWTPMHAAADSGHLDVVKFLVEKGAEITEAVGDMDGKTPLHAAAESGHLDVVKLLVEKGADIGTGAVDDMAGWTPMHAAAEGGHLEVVRFLLEEGVEPTRSNGGLKPWHLAAGNGNLQLIKEFEAATKCDYTETDVIGRSALFLSARYGHASVVEHLLSSERPGLTITDWCDSTPLFTAVANGHQDVVELLLPHYENPLERLYFNHNLVWWARRGGSEKVVRLLLGSAGMAHESTDSEDDVPGDPVIFDAESAWCDACTLCIPTGSGFECTQCTWMVLCGDCFEKGVRCQGSGHMMVRGSDSDGD